MVLDKKDALRIERTACGDKAYVFKCASCDSEVRPSAGKLKVHSGKCKSCTMKGKPLISSYTQLLVQKKRGLEVSLSYEQFIDLCQIPKCHYCGKEIKRNLKRGDAGYRGYALDRKDNTQGYTVENSVPCCWNCNQTKNSRFTYEEFMELSIVLKEQRERKEYQPRFTICYDWESVYQDGSCCLLLS